MERRDALIRTAKIAGSVALAPSLLSLLQACQGQPRLTWQPIFLSLDQAETISALVDTILPKTNTPGGLDMKVDMFMDLVFSKLYTAAGQEAIVTDIKDFNSRSKEKFGKKFGALSPEDRTKRLQQEEATSGKYNGKVWGTAVGVQQPVGFYRSMKSLMLWGYFTSAEIGKNVLNYDPIPGEYKGCVPLSEVGKISSL